MSCYLCWLVVLRRWSCICSHWWAAFSLQRSICWLSDLSPVDQATQIGLVAFWSIILNIFRQFFRQQFKIILFWYLRFTQEKKRKCCSSHGKFHFFLLLNSRNLKCIIECFEYYNIKQQLCMPKTLILYKKFNNAYNALHFT